MAEINLPEKDVFQARVDAISMRVHSISESNTMARLLHSNFKTWLQGSAISPVKLTQDLDADNNGMISGDEFAGLLGKMTGERPPEWVVELVFSFVEADTAKGIPISDWMAFLAATGLDIPEELYHVPVTITGSILLDSPTVMEGTECSVTVSFNVPVDAYEVKVSNTRTGDIESFTTSSGEMDSPMLDEFMLESDEQGIFTIELFHLGIRLDQAEFEVYPAPQPVEEPLDEPDSPDAEPTDEKQNFGGERDVEDAGFAGLLTDLEHAKLRSDAQAIIDVARPQRVRFTVLSMERTLMGMNEYNGGTTLTCSTEEGDTFEVMMKSDERSFSKGQHMEATVVPHSWSVALRHLVCRES